MACFDDLPLVIRGRILVEFGLVVLEGGEWPLR